MRTIIPCFLLVNALTICACSSSSKRVVAEAPPPAYQASPESTPVQLTAPAAAKLSEVQEAVKRVFKDGAVIDTNYNPNFLTGDFNGDGSQDIAVVLKPVKLDLMNQELPPWLVREPRARRDPRVLLRIDKDETLLAVIHGFGANDWRDTDATQTFVLKNVVGYDLKVHTGKEFVTANSGRKLPCPQGDLIGETVQGNPGYLYFAAATYSWYDPKAFTGAEAPPGVFHKPRTR
ncbi:MAG TPA: hypothetical protein VGQ41_00135 [Pyrinomonadaceae bacterium]|jgi:hypothetical protein|nr:hypothetical protein [Pyrinomonadaceae bacterium]